MTIWEEQTGEEHLKEMMTNKRCSDCNKKLINCKDHFRNADADIDLCTEEELEMASEWVGCQNVE